MASISVAEALSRVLADAMPLAAEHAPLAEAYGRVQAGDLAALLSQPPADVSAMDGYAVRAAELATTLGKVEGLARELDALQRDHRAATLASVAPGELTAVDALARIDAARRLDRIAHHAWRSAAHLLGRGA